MVEKGEQTSREVP